MTKRDEHFKCVAGYHPPEPNDYMEEAKDPNAAFCTVQFDAARLDSDTDGNASAVGLTEQEASTLHYQLQSMLKRGVRDIGRDSDKVANLLTDLCNDMSFASIIPKHVEALGRQHPTLQQSFAALCFAYIQALASGETRADARNEYAIKIAKQMMEGLDKNDLFLPLI